MFAQISIHTSSDTEALLIPKEALIRTGNQDRVVLALGEGSFKSIEVMVGRFDSESVEILSGLADGEQIVSSAQFLLDSESSKTSDFKRMNHDDSADDMSFESGSTVSSATVNGSVKSVMVDHRMVNIDREAIVEWDREADNVDFIVDEGVDMSLFFIDAYVMFTFEIRHGNFIIVSAMAMPTPDTHGEGE